MFVRDSRIGKLEEDLSSEVPYSAVNFNRGPTSASNTENKPVDTLDERYIWKNQVSASRSFKMYDT